VQTSVGALSSHLISRTPVRAIKDATTTAAAAAAAALVLDFGVYLYVFRAEGCAWEYRPRACSI